MVIHSTLSGADNHDPRGTNGDPLVFPLNTANVLQWEDTNGDSYFNVSTATGFEGIIFGNATSNPSFAFVGSGEPNAALWTVNQRASSPSSSLLKGKVYGLQVGGTGPTELHYIDSAGNVTQITSVGSVSGGGGGGGTLDAAYDFGGAHLGRQINIDAGFPVQLTASGVAVAALEITGHIAPSHSEVVIGNGTHTTIGANAIIVGSGSQAGTNSVAVGFAVNGSGASVVALGAQVTASHTSSIVLGRSSVSSAANQLTIGSATYYVTEAVLGGGNTDPTARQLLLRASNGSGVAGWDLLLSAGLGASGNAGGRIALATSDQVNVGTRFFPWDHDPADVYGPHTQERSNSSSEPVRKATASLATTTLSGTLFTFDLSSIGVDTYGWALAKISGVNASSEQNAYQLMARFSVSTGGIVTVGTVAASQVVWEEEDSASMTVEWDGAAGDLQLLFTTGAGAQDWKWHLSVEIQMGT